MPLQDIIEKIKKEKAEKIKEIEKQHKDKIFLMEKEYDKKKQEKKEGILAAISEETEKEVSEFNWKSTERKRNSLLKKKRELVKEIYEEAFKEVLSFGKDQHKEFLKRILMKALSELEGINVSEIKVVPVCKDKELVEEVAMEVVQDLMIDKTCINSIGGFVLMTPKTDMDFRLETIFRNIREDTELKATKSLLK